MKRLIVAVTFALVAICASATTLNPVQLLNPTGSTSGQAIVSSGASSAPAWGNVPVANVTGAAALTGATFTGDLTVSEPSAALIMNDTSGSGFPQFVYRSNGVNKWIVFDAPSTHLFTVNRYVGGVFQDTPLTISNSSGAVTMTDGITASPISGSTITSSPISGSTGSFTTLAASSTVSGAGFTTLLSPYAPLASPALTGTPTAPTAGAGTNTTQLATTAFVQGINAGRLLNIQTLTASGTYTPTAGTNRIIVEVQASGGGGGGVAATGAGQNAVAQGGSAGTYASVYISGSITSQTVTINNPGAGGAAGINAGGTAGVTSFGAYVSCPGGIGGAGSGAQATNFVQSGASAPAAATISGVTATLLNIAGGAGSAAVNLSSAAAFFSVGGIAGMGFNTSGGNGIGGNGAAIPASSSASAGQNGVIGKVIIYEFN